ncbi:hypothetical protein BGW41_005635 [Actinomortierella wolfii]|nr:hypothetical protein BGW41_005635 [Actinomortierella wolfii]
MVASNFKNNPNTTPNQNPATGAPGAPGPVAPPSGTAPAVAPTPTDTGSTGGGMPTSGIIGISVAAVVVVGFIFTTLWMKQRQRMKRKRPFGNDDPFGSLPIQPGFIPPGDGPEMQMSAHNQQQNYHHHDDSHHGYGSPQAQAHSPHYLNQEVYHGYDGYAHDGGGYGGDHVGYDHHYGGGQDAWGGAQDSGAYQHGGDGGAGTSGHATDFHGDPNTGGGGNGGHGYSGGEGHTGGTSGAQGQASDYGPGAGGYEYGPSGYNDGYNGGVDQHLLDPHDGGNGYNDGGWTSGVQVSTPGGSTPQPGAPPTAIHPYAIPPVVPPAMLKSKDKKRISMSDYSNSGPIVVHPAYPPPPPRTPSPASPTQSYPSTIHTNEEQQAMLSDGYSPQSKQKLLSRIESINSGTAGGGSSSGYGESFQSGPLPYSQPLTSSSTVGGPTASSSPYSAPVSSLPFNIAKDYPVTAAGTNYGATDSGLNVERRISRQPQDLGDGLSDPVSSFPSKPTVSSPPGIHKQPMSTTPTMGLAHLVSKQSTGSQKRDPQGSIPNNPQAIREDQQTYVE